MPVTCAKGHVNDDTNRFCDQCGLPLGSAPAVAPQEVTFVSMPAAGASSVVCPVCGQENVPGTAFCDNCGAVLPPPQPAVEQPEGAAPAAAQTDQNGAAAAAQAQPESTTVVCANCGTTNDVANRFCENCGAALGPAEATAGATNGGEPAELPASPEGELPASPEGEGAPVDQAQDIVVAQEQPEAAPVAAAQADTVDSAPPMAAQEDSVPPEAVAPVDEGAAEPLVDTVPQPGAEMGSVAVDTAEPQAPEAAAPDQPAAPAVDPAERARLEGEIDTQRRLVEQLEGMQQSFGAATPAAITQGLDEARAALARAEQELAGLTGTPTTPATPQPAGDAADVPAPVAEAQQPPAEFAPPAVESAAPEAVAPVAAAPAVAPAPPQAAAPAPVTGPRFVDRDGKVLTFASGTGELVIGREDPVSGIHPDIDLTPHGGEAGGVSRRHALLRDDNGQWTISDLDSTNYTRVDGSRIAPNTPTPLRDGARVQFGRVEFEFRAI